MKKFRLIKLFFYFLIFVCGLYWFLTITTKLNKDDGPIQISNNVFLNNLTQIYKLISKEDLNFNPKIKTTMDQKNLFSLIYENEGFLIDTNQSVFLFGINFKNFLKLNQKISSQLDCKSNLVQSDYFNLKILSALYLECKQFRLQVSIFYNRGNFLWVPGDKFKVEYKKKFNDKPRAVNQFDLVDANQFESLVKVPANRAQFDYDYKNSEFLECDYKTAFDNLIKYGPKNFQNKIENAQRLYYLKNVKQVLESFRKDYWLAAGSLLGWYRDCGIIPHTHDADLGMFIEDYNLELKSKFRGDQITPLVLQFGLLNDSFELKVGSSKFSIDIFYYYEHNKTHNYCGYQVYRYKYRSILSKFTQICSADLLDEKFLIPCEAVRYVYEEYGQEDWKVPINDYEGWTNLILWGEWTEEEYPNAIKFYNKNGSFLEKKTLKTINKLLKKKVKRVYDD